MRVILLGLIGFYLGNILFISPIAANDLDLYRHSDFTDRTRHFDQGATVYIEVELDFVPEDEAVARLKSDQDVEITKVDLKRENQRATGSMVLPNKAGDYLLEISLRGQGSSYFESQNITVGDNDRGQDVQISITNIVPSPVAKVAVGEVKGELQKGGYPGGTQRIEPMVNTVPSPLPAGSPSPSETPLPAQEERSPVEPATEVKASPTPSSQPSPSLFRRLWQSILDFLKVPLSFLKAIGIG